MVLDLIFLPFFSLSKSDYVKNAIIFGVDNSLSVHIGNDKIYLSSW